MRNPGGATLVCLLTAVLCGSPVTVFPYPMSIAGGLLLWVVCACICLPSRGCHIWRLDDRGPDLFGNYAWLCDGNCHWHCDITVGIYIRSLVSLVFPGLTCRICAGSSSLFGCYLYEAAYRLHGLTLLSAQEEFGELIQCNAT